MVFHQNADVSESASYLPERNVSHKCYIQKVSHQKHKQQLTLFDLGGIIDDVIKQQQNFLQKQE